MINRSLCRATIGACLLLFAAVAGAQDAEDIPLTDGVGWMASSTVEKTAYIVGANDLLVVEYISQLKSDNPPTEDQTSIHGYWNALDGVTIDELIATLDGFYDSNPNSMDTPVMVVIWNTYVEPDE